MPTTPPFDVFDLGVTGLLLIVIWNVVSLLKQVYVNKKAPPPSLLACQSDPKHFDRIKELHQMTKMTEKEKAEGKFGCAWDGRNEVRDSLELQRDTLEQQKHVVAALKELALELRLTRTPLIK